MASARQFLVTQFGLSCFTWTGAGYEARTFNFHLFPRPYGDSDRRFLCQVSAPARTGCFSERLLWFRWLLCVHVLRSWQLDWPQRRVQRVAQLKSRAKGQLLTNHARPLPPVGLFHGVPGLSGL